MSKIIDKEVKLAYVEQILLKKMTVPQVAKDWEVISPMFKFSAEVRKVIYITNSIENLNSTYRRSNRGRSVFPSDTALLKSLYLLAFYITKKWTNILKNWGKVYNEFAIMYKSESSSKNRHRVKGSETEQAVIAAP